MGVGVARLSARIVSVSSQMCFTCFSDLADVFR